MIPFYFTSKAPLYCLLQTEKNAERVTCLTKNHLEIPKSAFQIHLLLLTVCRQAEFGAKSTEVCLYVISRALKSHQQPLSCFVILHELPA